MKKRNLKGVRLDVLKEVFSLLHSTYINFNKDKGLKLSAALSYYTIFSLPPLMVIIISLSGLFFGEEAVRGQVFSQLNGLVGAEAAMEVQDILKNVRISQHNHVASLIGVIVLVITASGVFAEIQDSMNYIWHLKVNPKRRWMAMAMSILIAFSMVASFAFLLLVGLVVNGLMDILSGRLQLYFPNNYVIFFTLLGSFFVFVIVTILFALIYCTLPDGKIAFKDGIIGAGVTALLFMVGKFAIGLYLGHSNIASTYGTSASIVVILLWVYYSAIILYFGAEFTKVYSSANGRALIPNQYAIVAEDN